VDAVIFSTPLERVMKVIINIGDMNDFEILLQIIKCHPKDSIIFNLMLDPILFSPSC
jgi:hypothetical protein